MAFSDELSWNFFCLHENLINLKCISQNDSPLSLLYISLFIVIEIGDEKVFELAQNFIRN